MNFIVFLSHALFEGQWLPQLGRGVPAVYHHPPPTHPPPLWEDAVSMRGRRRRAGTPLNWRWAHLSPDPRTRRSRMGMATWCAIMSSSTVACNLATCWHLPRPSLSLFGCLFLPLTGAMFGGRTPLGCAPTINGMPLGSRAATRVAWGAPGVRPRTGTRS